MTTTDLWAEAERARQSGGSPSFARAQALKLAESVEDGRVAGMVRRFSCREQPYAKPRRKSSP